MKLSALATLTVMSVHGQGTPSTACLSCKLKDSASSFLYSYSYCKDTNECLQDEWNFINKWCPSKWIPGWMLDIDADCQARQVIGACMPFVSVEGYVKNTKQSNLPQGGQCTLTVDATQALGRVQFNKAVSLGVLYNGYEMGQPITIPKGEVQAITIYNGNAAGPLSIDIVTSGAA